MPSTRRQEALALAEELLTDVEVARLGALDLARKTSRLARLLDDVEAIEWLRYETNGYPTAGLDARAWAAALRSGRQSGTNDNGQPVCTTTPLGELDLIVTQQAEQLAAMSGAGASGEAAFHVEVRRSNERSQLRQSVANATRTRDRVVGQMHAYIADRQHELRFGAAVRTAFEVVQTEVDSDVAAVLPDGLVMLTAALENVLSENPEHWSNAAATCRRLLVAVADVLQPPGPDRVLPNGKSVLMGENNYVNRLVAWIQDHSPSETMGELASAELHDLGRRLDTVSAIGSKGTHANVSRYDASRLISGTYLLVGDVLRLRRGGAEPEQLPAPSESAD